VVTGFFVLMIFVPFDLGFFGALTGARLTTGLALAFAITGRTMGLARRLAEGTCFFNEGLLFWGEARAETLLVERFLAAMPDPSGSQETRDYTYATPPGKHVSDSGCRGWILVKAQAGGACPGSVGIGSAGRHPA
jgi:hypothetical protein